MSTVELKVWLSTVVVVWGSGICAGSLIAAGSVIATVVGVLVTLVGGALLLRWYRGRASAVTAMRRLVAAGLLTPNEARDLLQRREVGQ